MGTCGSPPSVLENSKEKPSPPSVLENSKEKPLITFRNDMLNEHNLKRKIHGASDLILNEELNNKAQDYAKQILLAKGKRAFPTNIYNDSVLGENILISSKKTPNEIIEKWYKERDYFNFSLNKYQKNTGHFTQLVWKSTKEIGVGLESDSDNNYCCVALYYPGGNIIGEFSDNVVDSIIDK